STAGQISPQAHLRPAASPGGRSCLRRDPLATRPVRLGVECGAGSASHLKLRRDAVVASVTTLPGISISLIARFPVVGSSGEALVMFSLILVVPTGSKVIVDGASEAAARATR